MKDEKKVEDKKERQDHCRGHEWNKIEGLFIIALKSHGDSTAP